MTEAFELNISDYFYSMAFIIPAIIFLVCFFLITIMGMLGSTHAVVIISIFMFYNCLLLAIIKNNQQSEAYQKNEESLAEHGYVYKIPLLEDGLFFHKNLTDCLENYSDYIITNEYLHVIDKNVFQYDIGTDNIYIFCKNKT